MHTQNAAAAAAAAAAATLPLVRSSITVTTAAPAQRGGGPLYCKYRIFEPRITAKNARQKEEFWQKKKRTKGGGKRSLKLVATCYDKVRCFTSRAARTRLFCACHYHHANAIQPPHNFPAGRHRCSPARCHDLCLGGAPPVVCASRFPIRELGQCDKFS
jgi:hypothetical protein